MTKDIELLRVSDERLRELASEVRSIDANRRISMSAADRMDLRAIFAELLSRRSTDMESERPAPAAQVGGVVVKPLEWRKSNVADRWVANHAWGEAEIIYDIRSDEYGWFVGGVWFWCKTLDEAKARSQEVHDHRVLSTLSAISTATGKGEDGGLSLANAATALESSLGSEGQGVNRYLRDDIEQAIRVMRAPPSPSIEEGEPVAWQSAEGVVERLEVARDFPKNTCPASRHVQMIGEALIARQPYAMIEEDPEYVGQSILSVVASLYETRTELSEAADTITSLSARAEAAEAALATAREKALEEAIAAAASCAISVPLTPGAADGASMAANQIIAAIRSLTSPPSRTSTMTNPQATPPKEKT